MLITPFCLCEKCNQLELISFNFVYFPRSSVANRVEASVFDFDLASDTVNLTNRY